MPNAKRQIELDFIRGVAILLVLHFHASADNVFVYPLPGLPLINFGWAGVNVFFVLSGFLVGGLLCKEWLKTGAVDAKRFLVRRAFKIWPGYYALIAAYVITRKQPLNTFLWQNLLNIQNYVGSSISHSWSLAIEEHFYLMLSFVTWWCASKKVPIRRFFVAIAVVAACVAVFRTFLAMTGRDYFFQTHTRIDSLLLGVMLAITFHFRRERFLQLQSHRLLLGLVLTTAIVTLFLSPQFYRTGIAVLAADLGSAAFLLLLYKPGQRSHGRLYQIVAFIGVYSYGIYLWHPSVAIPVIAVLRHLGTPWLQYPARVIAGIALGVIMTKLIEFPFLRLREAMAPASRTPVASRSGIVLEERERNQGRVEPLAVPVKETASGQS